MLSNFLAWRKKKKKAGTPQGSLLPFIMPVSQLLLFSLLCINSCGRGKKRLRQQHTTETGNNNLHFGAWWPATLLGAGDNSQGMVTHTNSWENYLMAFQVCWFVLLLHLPGGRCGAAVCWQPHCAAWKEFLCVLNTCLWEVKNFGLHK